MIEVLASLPTHLRKRLASALESGLLTPPYSTMSLQSVLGSREGDQDLLGALRELEQMGISGLAAGGWLRTVEETTSRTPQPDLVWSGPEVPGLHARDTRRVYEGCSAPQSARSGPARSPSGTGRKRSRCWPSAWTRYQDCAWCSF